MNNLFDVHIINEDEEQYVPYKERVKPRVYLSVSEKTLACQLIWSEKIFNIQDQTRLIHTLINRLNHPDYPNTMIGVIMQPNQFANSHKLNVMPVRSNIQRVVEEALFKNDLVDGAVNYL